MQRILDCINLTEALKESGFIILIMVGIFASAALCLWVIGYLLCFKFLKFSDSTSAGIAACVILLLLLWLIPIIGQIEKCFK